jgi:hypothetical protein
MACAGTIANIYNCGTKGHTWRGVSAYWGLSSLELVILSPVSKRESDSS